MKLFDHPASANCLKARVLLRQLEIAYEAVEVDLFRRETRTPEHLARNPDGRVPVLELDAGQHIAESGAILLYLAEGTPLYPSEPLARAVVHQWMFFEQNQLEAQLAAARFLVLTGRGPKHPEVLQAMVARGQGALRSLARGLADGRAFIAGEDYTVADIALHAYTHCAADAGADARELDVVAAWLDRVEATPRFVNDLAPFPEHALAS